MEDQSSGAAGAQAYNLVVRSPFGDYQRGQLINDPEEIAKVLASENARDVQRVHA